MRVAAAGSYRGAGSCRARHGCMLTRRTRLLRLQRADRRKRRCRIRPLRLCLPAAIILEPSIQRD